MATFSQSVRWRRRRRHDILLDGCRDLAALFSSFWSFIYESQCACSGNSRRQRVSPISEDSDTEEIALDGYGWIDPPGTSIHEGSTSQVHATRGVPNNDDRLPDYEVTGSSSCAPLNPSLGSLSNDLSPTASTTEHVREGPNQSTPASQIPPTANSGTVDDRLLNFKVTDSSSCKPFSSSFGSTSIELTGTNTVDTHELLSHCRPASQIPPIYSEASTDDPLLSFENSQFVGNMEEFMSGHDLKYTNSSSCKFLPLSSNFLSSDPTGTTKVDSPELLNFCQMDPADDEADSNE